MKRLFLALIISLSVASLASLRIYSSPAATENWVKSYVSTNSASSVAVSNGMAVVTKNTADGMIAVYQIFSIETGTNAVEKASRSLIDSVAPLVGTMISDDVGFSM